MRRHVGAVGTSRQNEKIHARVCYPSNLTPRVGTRVWRADQVRARVGTRGLLIVKNSSACMPVDWQSSSECDACLSSPDSRRRLTFPRLSTATRLPPVPTITLWRATGGRDKSRFLGGCIGI
eukprot:scaffold123033_cov59-Cyclotella_meneghiniana.AAC.3